MIKLICLDVDGCMSDGKITYTAEGLELKNFNVKDGFGIKTWMNLGYHIAIITGRNSTIVAHRARELGIVHVFQGSKDKRTVAQELSATLGLEAHEVAAIGDDLNDYRLLEWCGRSFVPADGMERLDLVAERLKRAGGEGCVREMIEIVLAHNNDQARAYEQWV